MQADPALAGLLREVRILGVNETGHESGNAATCDARTIPWLQDVPAVNVWGSWQVNWRDVIILDQDNVPVTIFNLTTHDLGIAEQYVMLRDLLVDAATAP